MKKTFFITFLLLTGFAFLSNAQKRLDAIYLKNGSVIRGKINEREELFILDTYGRNRFALERSEIDSIHKNALARYEKLPLPKSKFDSIACEEFPYEKVGYKAFWELGTMGAKLINDYFTFTFHVVNGYLFHNGVFLGFGSGVEFLDIHVVPFFIDFRYHFLAGGVSPYFFINPGWVYPFGKTEKQEDVEGGKSFSMGMGLRGITRKKRNYNFSLGYRYQHVKAEFREDWGVGRIVQELTYKRFYVKFGWYFN